jgi:hypothetical protein
MDPEQSLPPDLESIDLAEASLNYLSMIKIVKIHIFGAKFNAEKLFLGKIISRFSKQSQDRTLATGCFTLSQRQGPDPPGSLFYAVEQNSPHLSTFFYILGINFPLPHRA